MRIPSAHEVVLLPRSIVMAHSTGSPTHRAWLSLRILRRRVVRGSSFDLLVDGEQFIPAIMDAVRRAKRQILFETYIIWSDSVGKPLIDLLCKKAREGLAVYVVIDAIGSMAFSSEDEQACIEAGVHLRRFHDRFWYRPFETFFRTHRRVVVIDDQVGFVGGFGFSEEWIESDAIGSPWHELVWQVKGRALGPLSRHFAAQWQRERRALIIDAPAHEDDIPCVIINKSRSLRGTLTWTLMRLIRRARHRVWIATGYFVPSAFIRHALRRAAQRGVDVRIIVPGSKTDHHAVRYAGRRRYSRLLKAGATIYEADGRMMHAKAMVVDDDLAMVGSANLDNWSLRYNRELSMLAISEDAVTDLAEAMRAIQQQSSAIDWQQWRRRSLKSRVLERFFGIGEEVL